MSSNNDKAIKAAFENPKHTWRTIRGIAQEAHVSNEEVYRYIKSHEEEIVLSTSTNTMGEKLYASRSVYRQKGDPLRRLSSAFKNRGG